VTRGNKRTSKRHDQCVSLRTQVSVRINIQERKKPSPEILRHMSFIRTDISEERIVSVIRVTIIGELENVSSN
jgi:hypothetical protein